MSWDLYRTKLYATGETPSERRVNQAKDDFIREAVKNPAYHKALRNGVEQEFLITRSEVPEKYKIVAFPGEDLAVGDEIEVFGEHWIVYQIRVEDTLQKNGIIWLCNHKFRWQNFALDIVEKWGVLDSGVYSTTIRGEAEIKYKDKQFKIILPLDNDTKELYVDKRLAVDKVFDSFGNEILNVYQITGYDAVADSFGKDGHLLTLNVRSDEFNRDLDNVEELICNYKDRSKIQNGVNCEISGSDFIRIGTNRKYSVIFTNDEGNSVESSNILWTISPDSFGVYLEPDEQYVRIIVPDDESLMGNILNLSASSDIGSGAINIKIIGL